MDILKAIMLLVLLTSSKLCLIRRSNENKNGTSWNLYRNFVIFFNFLCSCFILWKNWFQSLILYGNSSMLQRIFANVFTETVFNHTGYKTISSAIGVFPINEFRWLLLCWDNKKVFNEFKYSDRCSCFSTIHRVC